MKTYIGVKIIKAEPQECQRDKYNSKVGDPGYKVEQEDGHTSWSPIKPFEKAYRWCGGLTFGLAIEAAKKGHKIARKGWNGKSMFVVYQKGYPDGIPANKQTADAFGMQEGTPFKVRPYLQMRCADGSHQMWLASQSDILENDWFTLA